MKAADLRKSILQAAVQGKLVPQDKNDEPASELFKRIQAEKAVLIKEGKLKKEEPLPPIKEDEIPYDLPDGWIWCHLSDLGNVQSSKRVFTSEFVSKGIPFYRGTEIGALASKRDVVSKYYITDKHYQDLINQTGKPIIGDLLMPSICPDGRIWLVDTDEPFYFKDGRVLWVRLLTENIDNKYIQQALKARLIADYSNIASGTTFAELKIFILKQIAIPLPPLFEQERIVRKIDELMAMCDELEVAEKELDTLESHFFNYLPKSILQAAVQGKLVPQDKNDEPASELLKRIQAEKAVLIKEGKLKKEKPLPPISEDEIPYDLPDGWAWCRVGDISAINPRNSLKDELEISFLPMSLISQEYFGGHQQEAKLWKEVKSGFTHFAEGDVLLAKITPCFQNGKSCIAHNLISGYGAGTTELHVLRSILVDSRYLLLFLKSPVFITAAAKNMTGTAGQQRVPADYLKLFPFPIPPLAEQHRIVAKVDELMAMCDELKRVADQPISHDNVIPFPAEPKENIEPIAMAARGEVEGMSDQAKQAIEDLFGEDE